MTTVDVGRRRATEVSRRHRRALLPAGALLALGGGCAGGRDVEVGATRDLPSPRELLLDAQERMADLDAAGMHMEMTMTIAGVDVEMTLDMESDLPSARSKGSITVDAFGLAPFTVTLVSEHGTTWASREDGEWIELTADEMVDTDAVSAYPDFEDMIDGDVTRVGRAELDGLATIIVAADVEMTKFFPAISPASSDDFEGTTPTRFWIADDTGLIVQFSLEFDGEYLGEHVSLSAQNQFMPLDSDDVDITTPPEGDIVPGDADDFAELFVP